MGKRSEFKQRKNDFYPTPMEAVKPLIPFLPKEKFTFYEPCAGDGRLVTYIESLSPGISMGHSDIEPQSDWIAQKNALELWVPSKTDYIITNPPWSRHLLHPMIMHFSTQAPTWFLFDADWMHTKQAVPYLTKLKKVVSIGRVKWIENSKHTGKDNSCWYLFYDCVGDTKFYPNPKWR